MVSKKEKEVCKILIYNELLLILVSNITGCVSISAFAFLVGTTVSIASSSVRLTSFVITSGISSLVPLKYNVFRIKF